MPALPSKSKDISAAVKAGCTPLHNHKNPSENRNTSSRFIFKPCKHIILSNTVVLTVLQSHSYHDCCRKPKRLHRQNQFASNQRLPHMHTFAMMHDYLKLVYSYIFLNFC